MITQIPSALVALKKTLEILEVNKNSIVTPPKAILKNGLPAIIQFLEQLTLSKVKWSIVKCVIVGKEVRFIELHFL